MDGCCAMSEHCWLPPLVHVFVCNGIALYLDVHMLPATAFNRSCRLLSALGEGLGVSILNCHFNRN